MSRVMLVEAAAMIAEVLIACVFFGAFLGHIRSTPAIGAAVVLHTSTNFTFAFVDVNMTLSTLFNVSFFIALTFLFAGNVKWKLFAGILFSAFVFVTDFVVMFALMLLFNATPYELTGLNTTAVVGLVTSKLLLLVLVKIISGFRSKENTRMPLRHWALISPFPVTGVVILLAFFNTMWDAQSTEIPPATSVAIAGVLYINIFAFQLFEFFSGQCKVKMVKKSQIQRKR